MFSAAVWSLEPGPAAPARRQDHAARAHPRTACRIPGSRWGIDNPDSVYRVIPISGSERYVIRGRVAERRHDRELLHALGREDEHDRRALGARPRARRRSPLHDHRRQRPDGRPAEPHPLVSRGARVLHPRRAARLGAGRAATSSRSSGSAARPATPPRTRDEQAELTAALHAPLRRLHPEDRARAC